MTIAPETESAECLGFGPPIAGRIIHWSAKERLKEFRPGY